MTRLLSALLIGVALAANARVLTAQQAAAPGDALAQAHEFERRGNHAAAAEAFGRVLAARPGDASALLGLERSLDPLGRNAEILPHARKAVGAVPNAVVYPILIRTHMAAGARDSAQAATEAWARLAPREPGPWRELVTAAMQRRDRPMARVAIDAARQRLGQESALAYEAAQLRAAEGDWSGAAGEWLAAIAQLPGYHLTALAALTPAPERTRAAILETLDRRSSLDARRLQAALMARWGDPVGGARRLIAALTTPSRAQAAEALTQFADQLRSLNSPDAPRARGLVLEELAERSTGVAASRARLESARAYQEAGDRDASRRMLGNLGSETPVVGNAAATLIGVLVDDEKMEEAERKLAELRSGMVTEDFQALNRLIAWGWIRRGNLAAAERRMAGDSTVEGIALNGRLAVYRGDITGGVNLLRMAGPYAGTREEATDRTALLALLQPIEADSLPELGTALLLLAGADSGDAADALEKVAARLPVEKGGAELRLLAGRIERLRGEHGSAERLLRAAGTESAPATAPAAELELARLLITVQRQAEAVTLLEHLILTYPTSALVPQARRLLDETKGAIPRT
jgi:tetratricopeptide (TPR) repeat protein